MPRLPRVDVANEIYHVINRANGRMQIFSAPEDYRVFEKLMEEAKELTGMRIFAYEIMPNHWHLVLSPRKDGDLGIFMHHLGKWGQSRLFGELCGVIYTKELKGSGVLRRTFLVFIVICDYGNRHMAYPHRLE